MTFKQQLYDIKIFVKLPRNFTVNNQYRQKLILNKMKKYLFILCLAFMYIFACAQEKSTLVIKQGTKLNYFVLTPDGQSLPFSASLDSLSADYIKIGWSIEGLGSGNWIMKKNSLDNAARGRWGQPVSGSDEEVPQDEAVRVFRDFAQRFDVAVVFRLIDGAGQLVIRLQLVRLVGKTVGMIQLHQLLPKLRQLRFLLGGQFFLFVRRRRQFLVILVQPRLGLREIFLGLFHLVGVVADE